MNKFLEEILEQPKSLQDTLDFYLHGEGRADIENILKIWKSKKFEQIVFTGMGSSFFASQAAVCLLNKYGIKAFVINSGELLHYQLPLIQADTLLICVSQSGESYEAVKILDAIPEDVVCIGISNEADSALAQKTKARLLSKAGPEEMTSTKTFVSTLLVLNIFALAMANDLTEAKIKGIKKISEQADSIIKTKEEWLASASEFLGHPAFVQLIGRGETFASVQQSALMFKEGARNPASGLLGGEFRHGPLEMVKKGFKAIVFAPEGNTYQQSIKLVEDIIRF